ncbi:hypothetical protein [Algibacter sp.]|uniref:hypothetical protein n=1 Tax=Algibacter sp. TaxID=1872428 RepID=UPI003C729B27
MAFKISGLIIIIFLSVGCISCKTSEKEINKLDIAKRYYKILDKADDDAIALLLGDSIVIRENESDYQETFTKKRYSEWLKWDAVFVPTYKILEIEQDRDIVKAKISKIDRRILFLHEQPMVWNEIIRFENNKIIKVERVLYEVFNVSRFLKNRDSLVSWIEKNHPELNGFLNDQTEAGGIKYLKAIELLEASNLSTSEYAN